MLRTDLVGLREEAITICQLLLDYDHIQPVKSSKHFSDSVKDYYQLGVSSVMLMVLL